MLGLGNRGVVQLSPMACGVLHSVKMLLNRMKFQSIWMSTRTTLSGSVSPVDVFPEHFNPVVWQIIVRLEFH